MYLKSGCAGRSMYRKPLRLLWHVTVTISGQPLCFPKATDSTYTDSKNTVNSHIHNFGIQHM